MLGPRVGPPPIRAVVVGYAMRSIVDRIHVGRDRAPLRLCFAARRSDHQASADVTWPRTAGPTFPRKWSPTTPSVGVSLLFVTTFRRKDGPACRGKACGGEASGEGEEAARAM